MELQKLLWPRLLLAQLSVKVKVKELCKQSREPGVHEQSWVLAIGLCKFLHFDLD
jgi:hypothetical protein